MRTILLAGLLASTALAAPSPSRLEATTASAEARAKCAEGLALAYGFDHESAIEAFARAAELDPQCALAWWGQALAAGPNINNPAMEEEASKSAFEASRKALALAAKASPLERQLIEALARRYAWPAPADRKPLDRAYADAMRAAHAAYPDDPDVGALYAEALMDLRPWDLWTPDGRPQPGTEEVVAVLEAALATHPEHPGANHFYIHTMEMSPEPERALPAADRLRKAAQSTSHLVHMPAHIDMRLGHYWDAVQANERAIAIDRERVAAGKGLGFYTIYRAHNHQFLAWAAMFAGEKARAVRAIGEMVATMPDAIVDAYPDFLEGFLGSPYCVLVRFGMWDEILAAPEPPASRPATRAFRHYARGIALGTLGRLEEAAAEQQAFLAARAAVPKTATIGNNSVDAVLGVAEAMLAGELAYRRGQYDEAFALLREGVKRDDALRYDEPWGWLQPVRHALGALLLEQGRVEEAQQVYTEDLKRHPENGWALHGLAECLRRTGHPEEAAAVQARFEKAWAHADFKLEASCFCRLKTAPH